MDKETIRHSQVSVNGISMHLAEKGEGPVVLLLHGFPELWYSWRHQIHHLAMHGYRAVAPDLRGFGDTDAPAGVENYTMFHVVGDLVALIHALGQEKVYVVGHDWGSLVAWSLCMMRPDMVRAVLSLGVPFRPRHPAMKPIEALRALYGDDYYICAFQDVERAEGEFERISTPLLLKKFLTYHEPEPVIVPKEKGFGTPPEHEIVLPSWLSDDDVHYFSSKYEKTGFTGGLNYYRAMDLNWELTAPWTGAKIQVPSKFVSGDQDLTYHIPGIQEYIHNGGFKRDVPLLQEVVVLEGVGHFINQEKASEIGDHINDFIKKF